MDQIVYLNGEFLPLSQARISPLDRGFLFGDAIYEVIPSYNGRLVGFGPHIDRMQSGLDAIDIDLDVDEALWRSIAQELSERNGGGNLGIYLHVSRGVDTQRYHAYPEGLSPTLFAFAYPIPEETKADRHTVKTYTVSTAQDIRWRRCDIKSTALLGNVLHFQESQRNGDNEVVLYNADEEVTEAAASNVYVVKDGIVATPSLDYQKLPGITRYLLLVILRSDGQIPVEERTVTLQELRNADEVWLSSSSKDIAPVVAIDGQPVGNGLVGPVWEQAQSLYSARKYEF